MAEWSGWQCSSGSKEGRSEPHQTMEGLEGLNSSNKDYHARGKGTSSRKGTDEKSERSRQPNLRDNPLWCLAIRFRKNVPKQYLPDPKACNFSSNKCSFTWTQLAKNLKLLVAQSLSSPCEHPDRVSLLVGKHVAHTFEDRKSTMGKSYHRFITIFCMFLMF